MADYSSMKSDLEKNILTNPLFIYLANSLFETLNDFLCKHRCLVVSEAKSIGHYANFL